MKFFHIEVFLALVETGSYAQAAKRCYITERYAKQILKNLEADLRTRLFVNQNNRLELTAGGEVVLDYAKEVESCYQDIFLAIEKTKNGEILPLRFAIDKTITRTNETALNALNDDDVPRDVRLALNWAEAQTCVEDLLADRVDACLVRIEQREFSGFEAVALDVNALSVVVSPKSSLATKQRVYESDLLRSWVAVPPDYRFRFAPGSTLASRLNVNCMDSFTSLYSEEFDRYAMDKRMALAFSPRDRGRFDPRKEVLRVIATQPHVFCDYFCYKKENPRVKDIMKLHDVLKRTSYFAKG